MSFTSKDTESEIDEGLLTLRRTLSTSDSKATDSRATESLDLYQWRWLNDALIRRDWRATFRDIIPSIPPPPTDTVSPSTSSDDKSVTLCYSLSAHFSTPASTRMPQELIDEILRLVGAEYRWNRQYRSNMSKSMCESITSCSLVCLHWANLCRKSMFSDMGLRIGSFEEAESLAKYAVHGCPTLIPVHRLVGFVEVRQRYDAPFSFYHHMLPYLALVDRNCLHHLRILGPIPDKFPSEQLYAHHWGTPPASAPPPISALRYSSVRIEDIHLPSFACIVPYIRNFNHIKHIHFTRLTWDEDDAEDSFIIAEDLDGLEAVPSYVHVETSKCTDNLELALQVAINHPHSLVQILPAYEWQRILDLLLWAYEVLPTISEPTPPCSLDMRCPNGQARSDRFYKVDLFMDSNERPCTVNILLLDLALPDSTTSNIRVVGFEIAYYATAGDSGDIYHLSDLWAHLRDFPTLRAISIFFGACYEMHIAMESQDFCLQDHLLGDVKICLSVRRGEGDDEDDDEDDNVREVIGIDIKTLDPNGQRWDSVPDVLPSLFESL